MSKDDKKDRTKCFGLSLSLPLSPATPNAVWTPDSSNVRIENEPPSEILPYLYIGNSKDSTNDGLLKELGIRYILSVTKKATALPSFEFRKMHIPVFDSMTEDISKYFDAGYEFIEEARSSGSKVMIHCEAGISRSATFAIAYIIKHQNLSLKEAYEMVQEKRSIISPNLNFMGQLVEYESKLKL